VTEADNNPPPSQPRAQPPAGGQHPWRGAGGGAPRSPHTLAIAPQNVARHRAPRFLHREKSREYAQAMNGSVGASPEPGMPPKVLEARGRAVAKGLPWSGRAWGWGDEPAHPRAFGGKESSPSRCDAPGLGDLQPEGFWGQRWDSPGVKALEERTEKGGSRVRARNPLATSLPPRRGPELGMGREVS